MAESLREELLAIPGIDGADFDGGVVSPEGVRVRLSAGADPVRVGEYVRKVLAEHGLRSQMTPPPVARDVPPPPPASPESSMVPPSPPEVSSPVAMPDVAVPPESPSVPAPGSGEWEARPGMSTAARGVTAESPAFAPAGGAPGSYRDDEVADAVQMGLNSVAVAEDGNGLTVVATRTDGAIVQRRARDSSTGLDAAVVLAAAELTDGAERSRFVGAFDAEAEGVAVVTVVVEVGGSLQSGSAVVAGGRAFAVAQATWRALSAPV